MLGGVADEEIEFRHQAFEHLTWTFGHSRFDCVQQARFVVLFVTRVHRLYQAKQAGRDQIFWYAGAGAPARP